MENTQELKELIDSFVAYRNVLAPLEESLRALGESYESIRTDLENLKKNFSGGAMGQLDKIHSTLNAQAKSGVELGRKIDEYAQSGDRYARAVADMTKRFDEVASRLEMVNEIERTAEKMLSRLDSLVEEKRATYNLKELQRALDGYNKNVERISDFINKDVANVLQQNAEKIESIRRDNEALSRAVSEQGKSVGELSAAFVETSALLRKAVEGGSVNEEYLFDAFDRWAADRKVKTKKK